MGAGIVRVRPSGLKGASRRCATALRAALAPGASAAPAGQEPKGQAEACPGQPARPTNTPHVPANNKAGQATPN